MEVIDFRTRKQKTADWKAKVANKFKNGLLWIEEHKDVIIIATPLVIAGLGFGGKVIKTVGQHHNVMKQQELQDLYCYDRSLGHYWKLKRKPTNTEWVQIDRMKSEGRRLADILSEMRLLA